MHKHNVLTITLFLSTMGCAQEDPSDRNSADLAVALREALPSDTMTKQQVFDTNGFQVASVHVKVAGANFEATGVEKNMLVVTSDQLFEVFVEKRTQGANGGGVALFDPESGAPMLSAGDVDGDGNIDSVTYSVLDEEGATVLTVTDYEADGQADLRAHFKDGYFEIWYMDRWYRVEKRNGRRGIVVDGQFIELEQRDNRWVVRKRPATSSSALTS